LLLIALKKWFSLICITEQFPHLFNCQVLSDQLLSHVLSRDSSGFMIMLISFRKSGKSHKNKAAMHMLKEMAAKNASRGLASDKPVFQNRVASKIPVKEIIKGFEKYCMGRARRYFSNPMLAPMASSSPASPLAAIHTRSAPMAARMKARIKEKARNIFRFPDPLRENSAL